MKYNVYQTKHKANSTVLEIFFVLSNYFHLSKKIKYLHPRGKNLISLYKNNLNYNYIFFSFHSFILNIYTTFINNYYPTLYPFICYIPERIKPDIINYFVFDFFIMFYKQNIEIIIFIPSTFGINKKKRFYFIHFF